MVRKVEVVPYDPQWPDVYRAEIKHLLPVIGAQVIAFHHIGSTSVPGLSAKPTIDILAEVQSLAVLDACNEAMRALGYDPKGENGIAGRRYFNKLAGEVHLCHLHAFETGHPGLEQHLLFRDYLRAHPDTIREYEGLKLELAEKFTFDAPAYTAAKADFIESVLQKAAKWRDAGGGEE